MEVISIYDEIFEKIFLDIKEKYLSKDNFPKIIVGTGLSVAMGVPGMWKLSKKLDEEFKKITDNNLREKWEIYNRKIEKEGLEAALLDISSSEEEFVEKIKHITSEYILEEEYNIDSKIMEEKSGFEILLNYLIETVSVNDKIIDIMTPNYDRIIERICDKLNITTTLGFIGNLYQKFDLDVLKNPNYRYQKKIPIVRLFKPHGSINWIRENNTEYQINDYNILKSKKEKIDIITPGSMKYKNSMINEIFNYHREIFNSLITNRQKNYSLIIYGYGFNDQHFNVSFKDTTKNVLVLTRTINVEFLNKALNHKNWTIFYKYESNEKEIPKDESYLIYDKKKYQIDVDLWNIDNFSNKFI